MGEARNSAVETAPAIRVRGARVHNLKNLDVDIPLMALTVVTGVSGSGKSSLAFDTIYAEGQRRYVESLSAYARQFLERMEKPDVDAVDGIAPAVAIRQKAGSRNPRSTVATSTEIYDYLRLLYARVGVTYCPDCDLPVQRNDVDSAATAAFEAAPGERALVLFPVGAADDEAKLRERLAYLRGQGFNRLWQADKMVEFSAPESLLELDLKQPIFAVVDRLALEPEVRSRLVDAIEIAYRESGEARLHFPAGRAPLRFNQRFECKRCGRSFETPEPRMFSFNNPYGACPHCQGFSRASEISDARVVPDPGKSLDQGAIEPWSRPRFGKWREAMQKFATAADIPVDKPWNRLSAEQRRRIWQGEGRFPGVQGFFQRLEAKKYKLRVRVFLSRYREYVLCPVCQGARLRSEALWVRLLSKRGRLNLAQATALTVEEAHAFFQELQLTPEQGAIAAAILIEVRRRLEFLVKVGLEYLSLERQAGTLSGGEAQRIQLATALGSQLVGSLYVLDEPSIGLHPRDTARLITILRELRDLGNTILVVEHDPDIMRASDHLLDLGPAAGEHGGAMVAEGTWQDVAATKASLTGQYLRGERTLAAPSLRRSPGRRLLTIQGAALHNLRDIEVEIPLQMLVAVTGVSGSGKSTLVHEVLYANLKKLLRPGEEGEAGEMTGCRAIIGTSHLSDVILVDQSPIG
ncbi:MAG: AAA family ATPase, partial [Terriglobales bacterium]